MKTKTDRRKKQTVESIAKRKKTQTGTQTQEMNFGVHSVLLLGICKGLHPLVCFSFSQLTATGVSVITVCMYSH